MKNKLIYILLVIVLVSASCRRKKVLEGTKISASKYSTSTYVLHPQFKIFHESDNYSKLYFKLFTKELRFSSANPNRTNQAVLKISYKVTPLIRSKEILDSAKTTITIKKQNKQSSLISFFKIKDIKLKQYLIEVKIFDVYSNKKSQSYIRVYKNNDNNEQYFMSYKASNNKPIFTEYFKNNDTLYIQNKNASKISVVYYKTNFSVAEKPFITENKESLSLKKNKEWIISASSNKAIFYSNQSGIYILRTDTSKLRGFMKVQFNKEYPLISKTNDMIEALTYLLNEEELKTMQTSDNKKLSIDYFWLRTCNNKEKARELIKIWYNRAIFSNYYFTSYKKGIKTDRGMIYTVYGSPDDILYFDDAEKWIYINTQSDSKLEFVFVKQENSISKNDYVLIRESKYMSSWNKAIKTWRSGNIFKY